MFVTYTRVILAKGLVVVSASAKKKKQMMEALEVFTIHFTNVFTISLIAAQSKITLLFNTIGFDY